MPGTIVAALAGAVTLGAGYLLGFVTTANDRQGLRWQIRQQANEIAHLRERAEHGPDQVASAERAQALRQVHQHIDELKLHVDNVT